MKNYVQPGNVVTLTAPAGGVKSGDPLLVGAIFGVCATGAAEGAEVETSVVGVFDLTCVGPINAGAPVYWDAGAKKITATAAANAFVGVALLAVGGGGTVARVRLGGADSAALTAQIAALSSRVDDAATAAALTALAARVTALEGA